MNSQRPIMATVKDVEGGMFLGVRCSPNLMPTSPARKVTCTRCKEDMWCALANLDLIERAKLTPICQNCLDDALRIAKKTGASVWEILKVQPLG